MKPIKKKRKRNEETKIGEDLVSFMKARDWHLIKLHGSQFQKGLPDYVAFHRKFGTRWIELKTNKGKLNKNQIECFQIMTAFGVRIHVLVAATEEEYTKLWGPPNWYQWIL